MSDEQTEEAEEGIRVPREVIAAIIAAAFTGGGVQYVSGGTPALHPNGTPTPALTVAIDAAIEQHSDDGPHPAAVPATRFADLEERMARAEVIWRKVCRAVVDDDSCDEAL